MLKYSIVDDEVQYPEHFHSVHMTHTACENDKQIIARGGRESRRMKRQTDESNGGNQAVLY